MNIIATYNDMPMAVIGDLHGEWELIVDKVKYYQLENIILFNVGDFGVGFNYNNPREPKKEKKRLELLNVFLKKRNVFLYVVRGNHDNPVFFDGNHNFTNIVFMQDYDVVEVGDHKVLGIGGAVTVDRKPNPNFKDYRGKNYPGRKKDINWWPEDEKVQYNQEKIDGLYGIDVVITHTAPDFVYPEVIAGSINKWIQYDPELKNELLQERALLTKIYQEIDKYNLLFFWYYGHFHKKNTQKNDTTKFVLLDINDFQEIRF